jgi:hypothetical protein
MANAQWRWQRNVLSAMALAVLVLGVFSAIEAPHFTYTGFSGRRVTKVDEGGPAAAAGLRPGDIVDSVNGISSTSPEFFILSHRPVTEEIWSLAVQRSGVHLRLQLSPTRLPPIDVVRARSKSVLGLCLLAFTLWAFLTSPGTATMLLAVAGVSFGFLALGVPYTAGVVRDALDVLATLVFAIGTVVAVHFLLAFPARGRFLEHPTALWLLYAPAATLAIASAVNVVLRLRGVTRVLGTLWGLLLPAYVLWAIVLLVRRYLATPQPERSRHGLGLMCGATVAAVVPFLLLATTSSLWPATASAYDLYSPYASATFSIIPLAFSVAAVRSGRSTKISAAAARTKPLDVKP